jgi:hypothetical protein
MSNNKRQIPFQDLQCATVLASLSDSIANCSANHTTHTTDINKFITLATQCLNKHTSLWKMNWTGYSTDRAGGICDLVTAIEWPMHHVIPFDLIPQLQKLLRKLNVCDNIDFNFDSSTNTLTFRCELLLLPQSPPPSSWLMSNSLNDTLWASSMVTCEGCGHQWDGNAQCMCSTII